MEQSLPLVEQSIAQIYLDSQEAYKYVIPIYQRNYAWEEDEIAALVKDVHDSFLKNDSTPYYIGTLVTYKRDNNLYEVIDGQQRLTTIYLILCALGIKGVRNDLTYAARSISNHTIHHLDDDGGSTDEVDKGILNGSVYANTALHTIVLEAERKQFEAYFLHNVHIIHYQVPKDVNLNHYFEVMNSRGEQLEKHEIVKATLCQCLKDKVEMATFNRVWEACSVMNVYVQQVFSYSEIFGNNYDTFWPESFADLPLQKEQDGKTSILSLMQHPVSKAEAPSPVEQLDKFLPIIDFPNFLLIVLKLTLVKLFDDFEPTAFVLDDKELLNEFAKTMDKVADKAEFARLFAFNLIKAKYYLDNYLVHHILSEKDVPGENPWKLQYYYQERIKRYPKNLANSQDVQNELVHLLSLFEVTFTAKQRKNYLFYCLLYLFDAGEPDEAEYLSFLQSLADRYFYDVYLNRDCLSERNLPRPNAFDNVVLSGGKLQLHMANSCLDSYRECFQDIYREGSSDIPLFVFNYMDYRIWRLYANTLRGNKSKKGSRERKIFFDRLRCSDFELEAFNNFYFSRTRKSLEHYYPRAKAGDGKPLSLEEINCFGNFAMIGSEANSSGSYWDPKAKLDHYCDGKSDPISVASLKFKIMMQICHDNQRTALIDPSYRPAGLEWNKEDMFRHETDMLDILFPSI